MRRSPHETSSVGIPKKKKTRRSFNCTYSISIKVDLQPPGMFEPVRSTKLCASEGGKKVNISTVEQNRFDTSSTRVPFKEWEGRCSMTGGLRLLTLLEWGWCCWKTAIRMILEHAYKRDKSDGRIHSPELRRRHVIVTFEGQLRVLIGTRILLTFLAVCSRISCEVRQHCTIFESA